LPKHRKISLTRRRVYSLAAGTVLAAAGTAGMAVADTSTPTPREEVSTPTPVEEVPEEVSTPMPVPSEEVPHEVPAPVPSEEVPHEVPAPVAEPSPEEAAAEC
jgi:hypothetical protein